ncbi:hypothetical protein OQA88_10541 [Cercophora sp. LCS_1]
MSTLSLRSVLLLVGAALPLVASTPVVSSVTPETSVVVSDIDDAFEASLTALTLSVDSVPDISNPDEPEPEVEAEEDAEAASEALLVERDYTQCRAFPGSRDWPSRLVWKAFNLLSGGALIETIPIGAVCYPSNAAYNPTQCQSIIDNWTQSETHARDPTSVMSPLYQGETCMPQDGAEPNATCTLGGFPSYSVNVTSVRHIQLAVNFARNANLRLVVHNTGHDFLGKSTGAGALSIWTHNLKSISYISRLVTPSYTGPALKLGAGVQVGEVYAFAHANNVTVVGGECKGVGVAGGYIAGGGHSPLSSKYGLGADQVLSIDVVLPSGKFVTASEKSNKDLFWALRGGGGATFGVVVSVTVKAYPRMNFAGVTWTVFSGPGTPNSDETFWKAMYAYWRKFPAYAEVGTYGYSTVFPLGPAGSGYMWSMNPWLVPGYTLPEFKALVADLFTEWAELGFVFEPQYFEHDNFHDTWKSHFPAEGVASSNLRTGSRLFPKSNWADATKREAMFDAVRSIVEEGSALIQYNIKADAPAGTPASAANSHWRDAVWFTILGSLWADGLPESEVEAINRRITHDWMERLRVYGPGGYGNEGDVMEPDFGEAFFGTNYDRLLQIKRQVDPTDVFWAPTAVGSERWQVAGQRDWLTLQTGKLCKV